MTEPKFIPLPDYHPYPKQEMEARAASFYQAMRRRRTVRDFSSQPVPRAVLEDCIRTAGAAPNGANKQPWHFVVVSDPAVKQQIRVAAEAEEQEFYTRRASEEWLEALEPFDPGIQKPFLVEAPHLIVIFAKPYEIDPKGEKIKNYYVMESVGIATGFLIGALHNAGLASLTHTPSPMRFLNEILNRPPNERPFLILVVGFPAENAQVPDIQKKLLAEIATFI